ncbi:hypothetical protein QWZ10_07430 [Paracoccus cavernae]|uniref:DUF982 domain-containing protein n=1 Tax=Paracoccus cavernae TaxID=1571207 RepID=A0ABT8D4K4_9RHOB|nr:hypothetical protein [Paracoccus cavernae]
MAINHGKLDTLLGKIFDACASGEVSRGSAIGALAHVVVALEQGNRAEAEAWVNDPKTFDHWLALKKTA